MDDLTVKDVGRELGMTPPQLKPRRKEFMDAILDPEYTMDRNNDNFINIKAYDKDTSLNLESHKNGSYYFLFVL